MKSILIDAGPLIALFDKDDKYHQQVKEFIKRYTGRLITTWPVITEVTHMLDFNQQAQIGFLQWIDRGGLAVEEALFEHIGRIIQLTEKYQDLPMDLADASLVILAEKLAITEIVTIDSDYYVYRTMKKEMLRNVLT